jgi:hypothetical protein
MIAEASILHKLGRRYLLLRAFETLLFSGSVASVGYIITSIASSSSLLLILIPATLFGLIIVIRIIALRLYPLRLTRIATYLNQHYPECEASADLLIYPENELNSIQAIQKQRIHQRLLNLEHQIRFPHHLIIAAGAFVLCSFLMILSSSFKKVFISSTVDSINSIATDDSVKNYTTTQLTKQHLHIAPPAYTQINSTTSVNPHLKVIEGSIVTWWFEFNNTPIEPILIFSGKDSVRLKGSNSFSFRRSLTEAGFYQLSWKDQNQKVHHTDYYPIEILKDEAPKIEVLNLPQFLEFELSASLIVDLKAIITDDFGLTDSRIVATVSKGSGESIKFREEILRFTQPQQFSGKQQSATRSIDIFKMGLEPGDELYFYIEAFDNKTPNANRARTETFFIALKDTSNYVAVDEEGLGVDLMPEYFRSQRQIIIDSEKLLEEKKGNKISKPDFNSKSNELGYDQKVLRLKYGQFLGEEADSGIGHGANHAEEDEEEDPTKKFGHQHDTENEHHLVPEKKDDHSHAENDKKNPLEEFAHNHDNAEEATFFVQSVKTKLKTALTLMWDAELYLRMFDPATSLPYQYKILKLLKEISNDSRVYVHRTGFDPPPIKEDKRLSGDLSEIRNSSNASVNSKDKSYPGIHQGIVVIERLLQEEKIILDVKSQGILQKAGNELARVAIKEPGMHLKSLSYLRKLLNNDLSTEDTKVILRQLEQTFWKILPKETISPSANKETTHFMDLQFLQQLEELKHDR